MRLLKYDAARRALAAAHRVDEAKAIRDKAIAIAAYARQATDHEMIIWASEIRLRAERRGGELLRDMAKVAQRQLKGNVDSRRHLPKLQDLGITRDQSSDWQKLAAIPEGEFERRLEDARRDPASMTTATLLRGVVPRGAGDNDPFAAELEVWTETRGWLRDAVKLPSIEKLRTVRPGGGREALASHFASAQAYMKGLEALHEEGYL